MNNDFYRNISWMGLSTSSKVIMQLMFMGIMARYIGPHEYGIFAISLAVISFAQILSEAGLGAAIIQKDNLQKQDISTAHYSSIFLGYLCFFGLYSISNYIGLYYESKTLPDVIKILGLIFIVKSVAVVSEAILSKNMEFKYIAKRDMLSFILSYIIVGLPLAYLSFGVWALVLTMLTQEIIKSILVIKKAKIKTSLSDFKYYNLKQLLHYTSGITISGVFNKIATNIDSIIIGKFLGQQILGHYSRAYQLMAYPANMFGTVVSKVFFPTLAKIQKDRKELAKSHFIVLSQISLIFLPASFSLYFFSGDIVHILLGEKWIQSIPIFEILSFGIYFRVAYKINGVIARATGHVYKLVFAQFIYAAAISLSCIYGYEYGINAVASLIVLSLILQFLVKSYIGIKITGMSICKFLSAHIPAILCTCINSLILTLVINSADNLLTRVLFGILVYLTSLSIIIFLFRSRPEFDFFINVYKKVMFNAN